MSQVTRRQFLGIVGATAAGAGISSVIHARVSAAADHQTDWYDRVEERIPSICQLCPGGCGLKVRVVNGMPVSIAGNPLHPVNRGGLCPRGLAGLQSLYNPDRLIAPVRRVGPKGSGQWAEISWDEAIQAVAGPLVQLREKGAPEALAILGGEYRGLMDRLWARFAKAYGTPNYLRLQTLRPELPDAVASLMHGEKRPISFDLRNASFVLSFGCNWLEGWNSPVSQMQAYGHMRQGRQGHRAEIVHVESRLSHSAAKADLWVPVKPGTEGILALGLAHLILREQIYNEDFIADNTFGFEDWQDADGRSHAGFKQLVLEEYPPVRVSEITGVRSETIVTVARRLAAARPALVLSDNRSSLEGHDLFTRMAIHSLNALVGSIEAPGGVLSGRDAPPLSVWPEIVPDDTAQRGLAQQRLDNAGVAERFLDSDVPRGLAEAVLQAETSPIEVLVLHRANPLFGRRDKEQFREALTKIPLVVSFSSVPDEVSQYADLILPEHHFLEGWQDDLVTHLPGFTLFSIGRPAVAPLYNTRHADDIVLDLAETVGGAVAEAFPWESYEELLKSSAQGLFDSGRGNVVS
ncbi:MAG: molybdopterin-dependent oxidoreductase [Candidatus Hydrogenedentes bacterium]|nr:molybdopterin-dependent oxidoreductase [Candidatus Hydrogenedentota bacterium]